MALTAPGLERLPAGALVRDILEVALESVNAERRTARALRRMGVPDGPVHVLAMGKAALSMVGPAMDWADTHLARALAVPKMVDRPIRPGLAVLPAGHPLPDARSILAGAAVEAMARTVDAGDHLLVLLSGGASALVASPRPHVSLELLRRRTADALRAGADIHALNRMRRELELLKGGGLAGLASPARVTGLVVSDVMGNDLAIIGSGPLTPATPAPHVSIRIVADNEMAVRAALATGRAAGHRADPLPMAVAGNARELGERIAAALVAAPRPVLWVGGGETTSAATGGRGGRACQLALAAGLALHGAHDAAVIALATDGDDGNSGAAGALGDHTTARRARAAGLDLRAMLEAGDAAVALDPLGDLLRTGPTGTNVCDLVIGLAW